jgi:hypothetical protein
LELSERARKPAEPFVHGEADALACDLSGQAITWALRAHLESGEGAVAGFAGEGVVSSSLWAGVRSEVLLAAAGGERESDDVRNAVVGKSFADFADLAPDAARALAARLEAFAEALLLPLRDERRRAERVRVRRAIWALAALVATAVIGLGVHAALAWNEERRDLARKATWTTSSIYPIGSCVSPAQTCDEGINFFFHTNQEANPWVRFDLRGRKSISRVVVMNRLDCCHERAVPLVVEVSDDEKQWREVARRTESFATWRTSFPRVRARYVRIRTLGPAMILHLSRVRILR